MSSLKIPEIILLIKRLQEIKLFNTEAFEFYVDFRDTHRYSICPIDAIPFGSTGHNGIHFAFLTDFKQDIDLEKLPIICIAPSYDPPVNLVASNIYDFFRLITTIHFTTLLADVFKSQDDFNKRRDEWMEGFRSEPDHIKVREEQSAFIAKKYNLKRIDNVVEYLTKIRNERDSEIETSDSNFSRLGINAIDGEVINKFEHTKDLEEIKVFLAHNNKSSRLQFYRDITNNFILADKYRSDVRDLTIDYLRQDGHMREAENLKKYK